MKYSRKKLDSFLEISSNKVEYDSVAQDLVNTVLKGEKVTLAEESFACSIIKMLRTFETNACI